MSLLMEEHTTTYKGFLPKTKPNQNNPGILPGFYT